MSAIEASVERFRNICLLAETKIDDHFKRVDALEDKLQAPTLRIADLAEEIARQVGDTKQQECISSICLYIKERRDLELRPGKHGGICRIGDERGKAVAMTPKECALKHYEPVKDVADSIIEAGFAQAEEYARKNNLSTNDLRLNFKNICNIIAEKVDIKDYAVYHCLKTYVEEERVDLIIDLGRHGGLRRVK